MELPALPFVANSALRESLEWVFTNEDREIRTVQLKAGIAINTTPAVRTIDPFFAAATPAVLPPLPADAPLNRLTLAHWLVDPRNPLTARVVVNHLWGMLFGAGLVRTPEDFGLQGERPTHPGNPRNSFPPRCSAYCGRFSHPNTGSSARSPAYTRYRSRSNGSCLRGKGSADFGAANCWT